MDKEALAIIGGLYVENSRLKEVLTKLQEALTMKNQELVNAQKDKQDLQKLNNEAATTG